MRVSMRPQCQQNPITSADRRLALSLQLSLRRARHKTLSFSMPMDFARDLESNVPLPMPVEVMAQSRGVSLRRRGQLLRETVVCRVIVSARVSPVTNGGAGSDEGLENIRSLSDRAIALHIHTRIAWWTPDYRRSHARCRQVPSDGLPCAGGASRRGTCPCIVAARTEAPLRPSPAKHRRDCVTPANREASRNVTPKRSGRNASPEQAGRPAGGPASNGASHPGKLPRIEKPLPSNLLRFQRGRLSHAKRTRRSGCELNETSVRRELRMQGCSPNQIPDGGHVSRRWT